MRVPAAAAPRNIFAWTLLLLALATAGLWVRSHRTGDVCTLFVGGDGKMQALGSSDGRLGLVFTNIGCGPERAWTILHASGDLTDLLNLLDQTHLHVHPAPPPSSSLRGITVTSALGDGLFGFVAGNTDADAIANIPHSRMFYALAPHWTGVIVFGAAGTWLMFGRAAQRQRRRARGLCVNCGYDLRETRDRCPECGTPVAVMSSPAASPR